VDPEAPPWARLDEAGEYRELARTRLDHVVPINQPMLLCSQIQRSGGTLFSRLFDGHPKVHAHPHELKIGPKDRWPKLDLDAPDTWFDALYEESAAKHLAAGWSKPGLKETDVDVFPFLFLPGVQEQLFHACVGQRVVLRQRDVLDCYFTAYFNAWIDNQNLYSGPKRLLTAFATRTSLHAKSVERFFRDYPDGRLVTIVREPRAWFASASRHRAQYEELEPAMKLWRASAAAAVDARERYGDRAILLTYEQLVQDTEGTMRRVAGQAGLAWDPILLVPTFNSRPVRANSSDPVQSYGVLADRAEAWRDVLDQETAVRAEQLAGDLYERACA
jgi:hypothetical protein